MDYAQKGSEELIVKITMPETLYRQLKERAGECQRKVSQQVRWLVSQDLRQARRNPK